MMNRFFLLSLLISVHLSLAGQNHNYREIFGKRYKQAEEFISKNRNLFDKYFTDSAEFQIATSIVFPEIIRFKELYDKIEVEALKTLYVQYGYQYANFSIGPFQMKPTFAEQLEKDYCKLQLKPDSIVSVLIDTASTVKARIKRVERLSTLDGQLMYLSLFMEISDLRFVELKFDPPYKWVRFLSAAYNSGYNNTIENISKRAKEKNFHTEVIFRSKSRKYCYADISSFYFEELTKRH